MTNQKDIPHFQGWSKVANGYHTKTRLRNEFGLKPLNEEEYDATAKLYVNGRWGDYLLYHVDNCIEVKKRQVAELPITDAAIAEALYLINKSAKVSRDTKQENYYVGNHFIVKAAKTRQTKLYELKNEVLKKLIAKGKITVKGYHEMSGNIFLLLELEGFSFHMPIQEKQKTKGLEHLGKLDGKISAEKTISVSMNFFEAENLLRRYINGEKDEHSPQKSS